MVRPKIITMTFDNEESKRDTSLKLYHIQQELSVKHGKSITFGETIKELIDTYALNKI